MKNGKHTLKFRKQNSAQPTQHPAAGAAAKPWLPRSAIILLCLLIGASASWALYEFVIATRIPLELVGKWEVTEGPQRGAVFDFSRRGTLEAHFNSADPDKMNVMQASVAVEDKKLLVTTQNPHTGQYETRACMLRELTETSLIVEFEKGEVFKMARTTH